MKSSAWVVAGCAAVALLGASGCQWMAAPWLMWGEPPTKTVPAEYPHLESRKAAIAIWADSDTLFEYPNARLELSEHVKAALEANVQGATIVPNRTVVEYQARDLDWDRIDPAALGSKFKAERLILVELTEYAAREPDSPHLYRGRIAANIRVYDCNEPGSKPTFRTTLRTLYPADGPAPWGSSPDAVRRAAMESFSTELAKRFYNHKVQIK